DELLSDGRLAERRARRVGEPDRADIFRVVGHPHPVERRLDLDVVAEGVLDWLALGIGEGIGRTGHGVAEDVGVERPACVDVRLAEEGVAVGVALGQGGRAGAGHERQERAGCEQSLRRMSRSRYWHLYPLRIDLMKNIMKCELGDRRVTCATSNRLA